MSYLTDLRNAIATKVATTPGVRGASARPLDAPPPSSPWVMVGTTDGIIDLIGNRERMTLVFPLRLYVERLGTDDAVVQAADDLIDPILDTMAAGITYQSVGVNTTEGRIRGWTSSWVRLGGDGSPDNGTPYLLVEFAFGLGVTRARNYTA